MRAQCDNHLGISTDKRTDSSRKDLNHRPTRVNITTNRFSEGGACGWWQPYNMFAENI